MATYSAGRLINDEILLRKDRPERKALLPIQFADIWASYKKAQGSNWTAEEISFKEDLPQWEKLDDNTKALVETMLAFFSGADAIVNDNLAENFCRKIDILEVKCFYQFQMHMENVHNEVYSLMIDNLVRDGSQKSHLLDAIHTMPGISKLYRWAQTWIHRTAEQELAENPVLQEWSKDMDIEDVQDLAEIWCFSKQLVAFACVEGILFSGPFAVIFWLKEKGVLPALTFSNELISRDEGMHTKFACLLYSKIKHKPPESQMRDILLQAVDFEKELISGCLDRITGMTRRDMHAYIEFVGDVLLGMLGYRAEWDAKNPFPFMDKISISGLTNFFERKVGEYGLAGFEEGGKASAREISLDDDY